MYLYRRIFMVQTSNRLKVRKGMVGEPAVRLRTEVAYASEFQVIYLGGGRGKEQRERKKKERKEINQLTCPRDFECLVSHPSGSWG